jgi:hypothetical protein
MSGEYQPISTTFDLTEVRDVRRTHSQVLTGWAATSIAIGLLLVYGRGDAPSSQFFIAFGIQCLIWGAINLVFGLIGLQQARTADAIPVYANQASNESVDALKLLRVLKFSMKLNWLWLAIGLGLIVWGFQSNQDPALLGHGVGVTLQGLFLFVFDKVFFSRLRRAMRA